MEKTLSIIYIMKNAVFTTPYYAINKGKPSGSYFNKSPCKSSKLRLVCRTMDPKQKKSTYSKILVEQPSLNFQKS